MQKGRADEEEAPEGIRLRHIVHRGEEGTRDEVGGCWPSPATGPKAQHCSACHAWRKIAGSCTSEGLKCQCDCQEKQGLEVEIRRGASRSKSGRSKTSPSATATSFPSSSHPPPPPPPPCFSRAQQPGPNAHQQHAPPQTQLCSPQQAGSRCSKAGTTHTHMGVFLPHPLG